MPYRFNGLTGKFDLVAFEGSGSGEDIISEIEDFITFVAADETYNGWKLQRNGSSAFSNNSATAEHPGVVGLAVTNSGDDVLIRKGLDVNSGNIIVGGGEIELSFIIKIDQLATVGDDFDIWFGLLKASLVTSEYGTDAIGFEYQRSNSVNWIPFASSSSSRTDASGGSIIPVTTDWTVLRMVINADGTNVDFFIDGVSAGSITTNIPSVLISPEVKMTKTAGTTQVFSQVDAYKYYQILTTPRWL